MVSSATHHLTARKAHLLWAVGIGIALGGGCSRDPAADHRGSADPSKAGSVVRPDMQKDGQGRVVSATFEKHADVAGAAADLKKYPLLNEIVFIECGRISGDQIAPLADLQGLKRMEFVRCALTDEAAFELAKLGTLEELAFGSTRLSDAQLRTIGTSPTVTHLVLKGTSFQYQPLGKLTRLKEFSLFRQTVDFSRLKGLNRLVQLRALRLPETRITDRDLAILPPLPQLRELECLSDKITDAGAAHLKKLPQLRRLSLLNSNVTDDGLAVLQELPKLEVLNLEGCDDVTDEGVPHLLKCPSLRRLLLLDSGITGDGVRQLKDVPTLHSISIGENQITEEQAVAAMNARPKFRVVRLRQPPVAGGT